MVSDLSDFGIEVERTGPTTWRLSARALKADLARFTAAVNELVAAWEALPPGLQERIGDLVLTLTPTGPVGEEGGAPDGDGHDSTAHGGGAGSRAGADGGDVRGADPDGDEEGS